MSESRWVEISNLAHALWPVSSSGIRAVCCRQTNTGSLICEEDLTLYSLPASGLVAGGYFVFASENFPADEVAVNSGRRDVLKVGGDQVSA